MLYNYIIQRKFVFIGSIVCTNTMFKSINTMHFLKKIVRQSKAMSILKKIVLGRESEDFVKNSMDLTNMMEKNTSPWLTYDIFR